MLNYLFRLVKTCVAFCVLKQSLVGRKEVHTLRRKDLNKKKTLEFILLVHIFNVQFTLL